MPTDLEAWARRARVLLREVTKQVKPHAIPEALRWDIVDLLGEATYAEYLQQFDGDA